LLLPATSADDAQPTEDVMMRSKTKKTKATASLPTLERGALAAVSGGGYGGGYGGSSSTSSGGYGGGYSSPSNNGSCGSTGSGASSCGSGGRGGRR
jgi:hypothetical protein